MYSTQAVLAKGFDISGEVELHKLRRDRQLREAEPGSVWRGSRELADTNNQAKASKEAARDNSIFGVRADSKKARSMRPCSAGTKP